MKIRVKNSIKKNTNENRAIMRGEGNQGNDR